MHTAHKEELVQLIRNLCHPLEPYPTGYPLKMKIGTMRAVIFDGLADNTIVIWATDHGDGLPRAKRELYDSGLTVPMVIRWPEKYRPTDVTPHICHRDFLYQQAWIRDRWRLHQLHHYRHRSSAYPVETYSR